MLCYSKWWLEATGSTCPCTLSRCRYLSLGWSDPFSVVDAHTATSLLNVMTSLKDAICATNIAFSRRNLTKFWQFMSEGKFLIASTWHQLQPSSQEFQNLVNAHNDTVGFQKHAKNASFQQSKTSTWEILKTCEEQLILTLYQLIKQEEREIGNIGLQPYILCLSHSQGFLSLLGSYMPLHILSYAVDIKLLVCSWNWGF